MSNKYFSNKTLGTEFSSLAKVKKGVVVLYIKEELKPKKVFQDKEGRVLAVEIEGDNNKKIYIRGGNLHTQWGKRNFLSK